MSRAIALARPFAVTAGRMDLADRARSAIVIGCAAALILAGQTLPF